MRAQSYIPFISLFYNVFKPLLFLMMARDI